MSHDYDPAWDYEVDESPDESAVRLVDALLARHANTIEHLGLEEPKIYYIKKLDDHLARYVAGTSSMPVIVVDIKKIRQSAKRHRVDTETAFESTLLHELGHAYVDSIGEGDGAHEDEEEIVEDFAHEVWRSGDYEFAKRIMDERLGLE